MERDPLLIFWILDSSFGISKVVPFKDLFGIVVAEKEYGGSIIWIGILHRLFFNLLIFLLIVMLIKFDSLSTQKEAYSKW